MVSNTPSRYFRYSQASRLLPMPAGPTMLTSRLRPSRLVAWKASLSTRSSSSRPTNGASRASVRLRPPRSATTRSARNAGTGLDLPLRFASPIGSKAIAADAARWVDSPTSTVPGSATRLESRCRVDDVAGDHPLVRRAERHRGLAGQDPGARFDARPEAADLGRRRSSAGPDGAFGVVLLGDGRAPHRHDRVTDELLHGAAVSLDRLAGEVEVAGQQLADVLGVAALGQRREPDEVGEEHAHQAPFGDRSRVIGLSG